MLWCICFGVALGLDVATLDETLEYFSLLQLQSQTTESKATFIATPSSTTNDPFHPNRFYPLHVVGEDTSFSFERTTMEFKTNCRNPIQQMYLDPEHHVVQPVSRVDLMALQSQERLRLEYKSYLWDRKYPVGTQIGLFIPKDCQLSVLSISREILEPSLQSELDDSAVLEQPLMLSALTKWPFDPKYDVQVVSNLKTTTEILPLLQLTRKVEKKETNATAYFEYTAVPIEMPSGVYLTLFMAGNTAKFQFDFVKLTFNVKSGKCQRVKHFIGSVKGNYKQISSFAITRVKNTLQVEYQSHRLYKMLKTPKTKFVLFIPSDCTLELTRATRSVMGSKAQIQRIKSEITLKI